MEAGQEEMSTAKENLDAYHSAYTESFQFHDENLDMLQWYADRISSFCSQNGVQRLLSLGIGYQTVTARLVTTLADTLQEYVVVEGSKKILDSFQAGIGEHDFLTLHHGRFEEFASSAPFDVIEMGFVLEHVDDPAQILSRYQPLLAPGGRLFVAVPNALSLHRRLGQHAGLLPDPFELSAADQALGHKRYFDLESITELVQSAGLRVVESEGIFLKPFSSGQMSTLGLSSAIMSALYDVGAKYPELCNAVLLQAELA